MMTYRSKWLQRLVFCMILTIGTCWVSGIAQTTEHAGSQAQNSLPPDISNWLPLLQGPTVPIANQPLQSASPWPPVSIEAWANIFVAIGTIALAWMTWVSVSKTNAIIEGEDRRHQQGFYPLLLIEQGPVKGNNLFCHN